MLGGVVVDRGESPLAIQRAKTFGDTLENLAQTLPGAALGLLDFLQTEKGDGLAIDDGIGIVGTQGLKDGFGRR